MQCRIHHPHLVISNFSKNELSVCKTSHLVPGSTSSLRTKGLLQLLELLEKERFFFVFAGKTGKQYHFTL